MLKISFIVLSTIICLAFPPALIVLGPAIFLIAARTKERHGEYAAAVKTYQAETEMEYRRKAARRW